MAVHTRSAGTLGQGNAFRIPVTAAEVISVSAGGC